MPLLLLLICFTLLSVTSNSQNIIPEWEMPKGLVLVYPKGLPDNRSELVNCYKELIKSVLTSSKLQELTLIVRPNSKSEIEKFILSINTKTQTRFFETPSVQDIWARDYCPIYYINGSVCKALYNPSYFEEKHMAYANLDDNVAVELTKFLKLKINYFSQSQNGNLVFDGGNFINNGQGTAIVTNRLISDNETFAIEDIRQLFKTGLNISNLIIVPVEPGDETGHIDGMARFINDTTVMVSAYPDFYTSGTQNISEEDYIISKQFLDKVADTLRKTFTVIRVENSIPINEDKFPSAFGNYINFLRLGNTIYLPQYGIPQDKKAKELFKTNFPDLTIIEVAADIRKLSRFGGVLNCISWTYY